MVNEQSRKQTWDFVWQNIRRLEGALERGEQKSFADQALTIHLRINRLPEGKPSTMNPERFQEILLAAEGEASILTAPEQRKLLYETVVRLRPAFDAGNSADAQKHALTVLGYERTYAAG